MRAPTRSGSRAPGVSAGALVFRSRLVPDDDPIASVPLLDLLPAGSRSVAWVRGGEGLVGWGEASRAVFSGEERFSRTMSWWHDVLDAAVVRDPVDVPGSGPVLFGSFAFDHRPGTSVAVVPRTVVGRRDGSTWITTVGSTEDIDVLRPATQPPRSVRWRAGTLSETAWASAVRRIVARIEAGEVDKVVLARDLVAQVAGPLDVRYLMEQLHVDYPRCWTFHVAGLVGATPELLVRRNGPHVTSRVLAGTVRRATGSSELSDEAAAAALLASGKDRGEHAYAVASVAEALATHCTDLVVPHQPTVLALANVQHLSTDISATLADGASALALAASLHPTAAVCGTPTERARGVIREFEGMDRGRYAGPVGWVDRDGDGEFGIALRCGHLDEERGLLRIFAGCGVVAGSTAEAELAESAAKFAAMRSALAIGS